MSAAGARPLVFEHLALVDFRNIARLELTPAPRFNVISGDNGQGKTSLLEAIYFLATSRSFRTQRVDRLRREGRDFARVDARIAEAGFEREQRATLSSSGRAVSVDGEKPKRLSDYAVATPVIVFHPGDLTLTMGPAGPRRDLLDRIALFTAPEVAEDRRRYRHALRERQKALEVRGEAAAELGPYEALIARHGARLTQARAAALRALAEHVVVGFEQLVKTGLPLRLHYRPGGCADAEEFEAALRQRRGSDRRRHMATFGPQRDDLAIELDGRSARNHASQGQHRIITLALKLAELATIRTVRRTHPVLLLDDVSSELDPTRIGAVYDFLGATKSQVFVTTTRPELFHTPSAQQTERRDFRLHAGALVVADES